MAQFFPANDNHPFWRFLLDRKIGDPTEPKLRSFGDNLRNFVVAGVVLKGGRSILSLDPDSFHLIVGYVVFVVGWLFAYLCGIQLYGLSDMVVFHFLKERNKPRALEVVIHFLNAFIPVFFVVGMNHLVTAKTL